MGTLGKTWRRRWDRQELRKELLRHRRVNKSTGCWIWTGRKNKAGYGTLRVDGPHVNVHRIAAWVFLKEKRARIKGHRFYICHKCDTPSCFRPKHLFCGTPKQNTEDSIRKGRHQSVWHSMRKRCKRGHLFSATNTLHKDNHRSCRACHRRYEQERRNRMYKRGLTCRGTNRKRR